MDVRSAELTKYAANAMLATKISFMNELANLAERCGADIEAVRIGIGSDPRIGHAFIYPGVGYGGSCFPKDVKALRHSAAEVGYEESILAAVESVNERQKTVLFDKIQRHFGSLRGKTIALWGLAFKPNTDDMREAPSRVLMEALWQAGASVRAYDPVAMPECARIYGSRADLTLCQSSVETLSGADASGHRHRVAGVSQPGFRLHQIHAQDARDFRWAQPLRPGSSGAGRLQLLCDRPRQAVRVSAWT